MPEPSAKLETLSYLFYLMDILLFQKFIRRPIFHQRICMTILNNE